jgi:hypothetical protein
MLVMVRLALSVLAGVLATAPAAAQIVGPAPQVPSDVTFELSRARTDLQTAYAAQDQARAEMAARELEAAREPRLEVRTRQQASLARERQAADTSAAALASARQRLDRAQRGLDAWYDSNARPQAEPPSPDGASPR